MKKIMIFALLAAMLLSLAACGKEPAKAPVAAPDAVPKQTQPVAETEAKQETPATKEDPMEWGVTDQFVVENDQGTQTYYVNVPMYTGFIKGRGLFCEQNDTMIYISGKTAFTQDVTDISEILPTCFVDVQYSMEKLYGLLSTNYAMTIDSDEAITVGDYDMHTFRGTITFEDDGEPRAYQFVAYATTLKSNGAYAYWVAYDYSDDQSKGDLIEEYAYKMAQTFREEE